MSNNILCEIISTMRITNRSMIYRILIVIGYLSFYINLKEVNVLIVFSTLLFVVLGFVDLKFKRSYLELLFPFSSGILCFLMRQFYWDNFDFLNRVNNLLLISLIFSLILAVLKLGFIKKVLLFFNELNLKKRLIVIFVLAEFLFIISSYIIVRKGVKLGGDEPHYLVIAQSIARDFDLNVFDQYARNKYREFINVRLQSHAKVGKGFKKWYSFHLPGVSFTLLPFFFFKIPIPLLYFLIRSYMGLFGALLSVFVYLFSLKIWKNSKLSFFIAIVFTLTSPIFFMSIHIFAEIQAILLILSSLYILLFSEKRSYFKVLLAGFLLSITIFWGMKYAIFIYVFSLGFLFFFIKRKEYKKALLFILFPIIFQLLFFCYLFYAYGNFSPNSIYYGVMSEAQKKELFNVVLKRTPLKVRVETLLDYFFDQRDGLLLYNPFYLFAFPGLLIALRKFRIYSRHLLISVASFIYMLYHGFSTVRAGYCPQARYLVPVLWTLMLFSIIYYLETENRFLKRIFIFLPIYSVFVVIYQVFNPFTLYQTTTHDYLYRPGLMFQYWSSLYLKLPNFLPSFIKVNSNERYIPNLVFLFLFILFVIFSLKKIKKENLKPLFPISFLFFFVIFSLFPRVSLFNPTLVTKSGAMPHLIYNANFYPTKKNRVDFEITDNGSYRYTISTVKEAKYFVIELKKAKEDKTKIEIYNFDRKIDNVASLLETQKLYVKDPEFKKIGNKLYYQFTVNIKSKNLKQAFLHLQLYPYKKKGLRNGWK